MTQELFDLYEQGNYYQVFYKILELQSSNILSNLTKEDVDIYYMKLDSLVNLNFVNDALTETDNLLSYNLDSISKLKLIVIQLRALRKQGNFIRSLDVLQRGDFELKCIQNKLSSNDELVMAMYFHEKGTIFAYRGDLDQSIEILKKALTIREHYQEIQGTSDTVNNLGEVYQMLGEFELATKCYLECISLDQSLNYDKGISYSLNNLGFISLQIGDLDEAFNYFTHSYALVKKICQCEDQEDTPGLDQKYLDSMLRNFEDYQFLGELLSNLAGTYARKGDILDSLDYYSKALYVYEKTDNPVTISALYVQLLSLSLENKDYKQAKYYLELLSKMNASESKLIQIRIKFAKALILNSSNRFKSKSDAQELFNDIINSETVSWNISIQTMTILSELLFEEFTIFEDPVILQEARKIIDQMHTIAKDKKSYSLLTETYLLKMKFAVIEGDLEKALSYLDQAYMTSTEKKLGALISKVKLERMKLEENYQYWKEFLSNSSMKERFEKMEMADYINKIKSIITPFKD